MANQAADKLRVLIVVQNLPVPYDRRVWLEATTLQRHGHDVTVICPATDKYPALQETLEGVDIRRYRLPGDASGPIGFLVEFTWALAMVTRLALKLRRNGRFDVLHACNPPETYWVLGRLLRRLDDTKFLFDHHDLAPEMYRAKFDRDGGFLHNVLLWLERRTYDTIDHGIVTNESYRQIVVGRTSATSEMLTTVRSGPSTERFIEGLSDPSLAHGAEHVIAYLGEIGEQDGVEHLVEAVAILAARRDDFHVIVIGDGPALQGLKDLAVVRGVDSQISFLGRITEDRRLSECLGSATVGVVPDPNTDWSRHSTMNKVMEYMFFGLPVVAFDLIETRRSADDAGYYCTPDDDEALAEGLDAVLSDDALRATLARRAHERLRSDLSWEHSHTPLLSAYERAARGRSNPALA